MFISSINNFSTPAFKKNDKKDTSSLKYILPLAAALSALPIQTSALRDGDFADKFSKRSYETFMEHKNLTGVVDERKNILSEMKIDFSPELINEVLKNKTITLDAGHGGKPAANYSPYGAIYRDVKTKKKYYEKDINLAVTKKVCEYLKQLGANVIMTRESDDNVWYDDRTETAKKHNSDVFVSIHANYNADRRVRGASVYVYKPNENEADPLFKKVNRPKDNALLAKEIYDAVSAVYEYKSLGVHQENFSVLRTANAQKSKETKIPAAVLVELGFLSNLNEAQMLIDPEFQDKIACHLAKGIIMYLIDKL